jgi:hypothetical protein
MQRRRTGAIAATSRWNRVSSASSGWNAVAMMFRSRTATIRPSWRCARTSTAVPVRPMPRPHGYVGLAWLRDESS